MNFSPSTDWLECQNGSYLCNGRGRVEAPLTLETLAEAVRGCPKLRQAGLDCPGIQADISALFARRVSWKPRPGWRLDHFSGAPAEAARITA